MQIKNLNYVVNKKQEKKDLGILKLALGSGNQLNEVIVNRKNKLFYIKLIDKFLMRKNIKVLLEEMLVDVVKEFTFCND